MNLDINTISDKLYKLLVNECVKKYQDETNTENTENIAISNIEVKFDVYKR